MAYDRAILDAFTTHETALRFEEWTYDKHGGTSTQTIAARQLAGKISGRTRRALYELIAAGVQDEGLPTRGDSAEGKG